jgi:hypothetical protein
MMIREELEVYNLPRHRNIVRLIESNEVRNHSLTIILEQVIKDIFALIQLEMILPWFERIVDVM